jgi:hypothetical protein
MTVDSHVQEIEVDIDTLDIATLRELQKYVDECLNRTPKAARFVLTLFGTVARAGFHHFRFFVKALDNLQVMLIRCWELVKALYFFCGVVGALVAPRKC